MVAFFLQCSPLQIPCWYITIEADASKVGWGASCQGSSTGGPWTLEEQAHHIYYLELKAALLRLEVLLLQQTINLSVAAPRQHHGNNLPQQDGWHTLNSLVRSGFPGVGLVYPEGYSYSCRAPPRCGEHKGRQSRHMKNASNWKLDQQVFLHRHVCIKDKCSTSGLLQLESRSSCSSSRWFINTLERASPIHVPSVCLNIKMPGQTSQRGSICRDDSSSLAQPDLVSPGFRQPIGLLATTNRNNEQSNRSVPPNGNRGSATSSRLACIRGTSKSRGFLE